MMLPGFVPSILPEYLISLALKALFAQRAAPATESPKAAAPQSKTNKLEGMLAQRAARATLAQTAEKPVKLLTAIKMPDYADKVQNILELQRLQRLGSKNPKPAELQLKLIDKHLTLELLDKIQNEEPKRLKELPGFAKYFGMINM